MIDLSHLTKTKTVKKKKRVGRGYGSGRGGHTAGRGAKGQKARSKVKLGFAGSKGKKTWLKRLPLWRGKGRLKTKTNWLAVNLDQLNQYFKSGEKVDLVGLRKKGLIKKREKRRVKLLAKGKLEKKLLVNLPASVEAKKAIEKAGGELVKKEEAEKKE